MKRLAPELRQLVHHSVALWGDVLKRELGAAEFRRIESLRRNMTSLRRGSDAETSSVLRRELRRLSKLSPVRQLQTARAFTLMLEVMNACENAFRSREISKRAAPRIQDRPEAIVYVLTAHPTEARSPGNIWIFHEVLRALTEIISRPTLEFAPADDARLTHLFELAWRSDIVRAKQPHVDDEALHVYSSLLRDETLRPILQHSLDLAPIYFRTWVGGDKDGHPGVDAPQFHASLLLARQHLLAFIARRLSEVEDAIEVISPIQLQKELQRELVRVSKSFAGLDTIRAGDIHRVIKAKARFRAFCTRYSSSLHALHPSLQELKRLMRLFPALVVPLEFRESSDVLESSPTGRGLAIYRMLALLNRISKGGDPKWYVRGFIISMTQSVAHLRLAAGLTKRALGAIKLPIIPLFEQAAALEKSREIMSEVLQDRALASAMRKYWGSHLEMMLGYSDSSKEGGVLASRLHIAENMHALDRFARARGVTPVFFQGSGGSTDRGGGSVNEQTMWWPSGALRHYKVTVQGEMIERSLANPEITRGQLERIIAAASSWKSARSRTLPSIPALDDFADRVSREYRDLVASEDFLRVIEYASPYPYLNQLKFGSRPSKRSKQVSVAGLRAIPWILCWTQTRILFPTWWGIGRAWRETSSGDRRALLRAADKHPLFKSYVRALGYTLAKVELPVWDLYLEESSLPPELIEKMKRDFKREYRDAVRFAQAMLKSKSLIPWRGWLQESITLRSPMIHPLNLLQLIAMKERDVATLRVTVAGVSSGMMTTG